MLKTRFLLWVFAALGFAAGAVADTVVLKTGEKFEGRILSETDAQVTVEVQVTASIKDERIIKKAEIERIDKVQPDEGAWANVKGLALGKESFESADYQRAMAMLQSFLSQFPESTHAAEAKEKLAAFTAEKKRVDAGEAKLDGKWLSKDEVEEERVQINGRVLYSRMARLAAAGQVIDAMNVYDTLEKTYPGSSALPDAILLARKIIPGIVAAANQQRERLKAQAEMNKKRLETAQGEERNQLAAMLRNEAANAAATAAAAQKSGAKWLPLVPVDSVLSTMASRASSELQMMNTKPVDKMKEAIAAGEDAKKAIEAKDPVGAEKALGRAQSAWSNYELLKRLQPKIAEVRKSTADSKAAEMAAAQAAAVAAEAAAKEKEKAAKAAAQKAAEAAAPVVDAPKEESDPFYKKPIIWVVLVIAGLFGMLGMKAYHKFRDPNRNLLDQ
jgi:hypothetical protein